MHPRELQIEAFHYHLPEEFIAVYPLENRDESKLLYYKAEKTHHLSFKELPSVIPDESLLVLNDTKVFHARIFFKKDTGGIIEIFCLNPHFPSSHAEIFESKNTCIWQCYVGNAKKWKQGSLVLNYELDGKQFSCLAELAEKLEDTYLVKFSWDAPNLSFLALTEILGKLPIPPYLNRDADATDEKRYQTVFADKMGSVAAPTASLHFTPSIFEALALKKIETCRLTLHVGAGTFKPVTAKTIDGHQMHHESIEISVETLRHIEQQLLKENPIICVGTTAMRSLESIYWHAILVEQNKADIKRIQVNQWTAYEEQTEKSTLELVQLLLQEMHSNGLNSIKGTTGILIAPGYQFKIANALITNFHQPQSTLLLLIAAITGENWKNIYKEALANQYRFLSYGDSSLLWIDQS